jgi:hypothetical protein
VASHAQIEPPRARPFKWELLGIDLYDLEGNLDNISEGVI